MARKGIDIKCPICGHIEELNHLAGWSFIILKETSCEVCNTKITHDNIIKDKTNG